LINYTFIVLAFIVGYTFSNVRVWMYLWSFIFIARFIDDYMPLILYSLPVVVHLKLKS
jgi:hypothetical protein